MATDLSFHKLWNMECNVTLLVSRISAVNMRLSYGLRVISLRVAVALWVEYVTFTTLSLGRSSLAFVRMFLCPLHSSLSLPSLKCLKVHCHYHHGNCHAETCSCLLFRHDCWLTAWTCVCTEGLWTSFSVCISLCVSNQCFPHVYSFLLHCCRQSIPWHSLISVINKLPRTAWLHELHCTFIIRQYGRKIPEQCDRLAPLYI